MKLNDLLTIVGDAPLFETGLLLAGNVDPVDVRRQLSRWEKAGYLHQLRRGLYALAPPLRKTVPHPFLIANKLVAGSYVSLQTALAHYNLIPEYVPMTTSVTTHRPSRRETPLGVYLYRHITPSLFFGYTTLTVSANQTAFIAEPEKALLDLLYFHPKQHSMAYLRELRLQNLDRFNPRRFIQLAEESRRPKLRQLAEPVVQFIQSVAEDYRAL